MHKSKQARAKEFSSAERKKIMARDRNQCIFCVIGYRMEPATWLDKEIKSIMHYIPRSQGGLGVERNGAIGCQHHHNMLDNGNQGCREEMLLMFKNYLKRHYPDWNEEDLVYTKWKDVAIR